MRFAGDAMSNDYISAGAGGANIYDTITSNSPNFGALGNISMSEQSKEKQQAMYSSANLANAGISSLSALTQAANGAESAMSQAKSQASADMFGGAMSMIGSLGGAAIKGPAFNYGKTKIGAGGGTVGGYGTLGPNYGIPQ